MEKDFSSEMAKMQAEVDELKKLFFEFTRNWKDDENEEDITYTHVKPMKNMHPDPKLSKLMDKLCKVTEQRKSSGTIAYAGVFTSGGRQSNWIQNEVNTDELLKLIENNSASSVLQCIGNSDRLNLLLALLKTPMSVASLVEKCGFNSTGQVYHHLKPLIAADIVSETEHGDRGVYAVKYHRIQGIIMLLSGINDLLDSKYSQAKYDKE